MAALISFFVILFLSLTIVRVATVMLMMTGVSEDMAVFQARSAFTGTGFTSRESESMMLHPIRRKIVQNLMLIGNIGLVTFISSLMLTFLSDSNDQDRLISLSILLGGGMLMFLISRSRLFNWIMGKIIRRLLKNWSRIYAKDYDSLLFLSGEWEIVKAKVGQKSWLQDRLLVDLRLSEEAILVIGVRRSDGHFIGSPRGNTLILQGDELILYGKEKYLRELSDRPAGEAGDLIHQERVRETREMEGRATPKEAKPGFIQRLINGKKTPPKS